MALAALFYSISLLFQLVAAGYAADLFFRAKVYRLACGFLALGLGLMVGRRISPLLHVLNNGHINLSDAILSLPISFCLLLGMYQLKKMLADLQEKNCILDQLSKVDTLTGALSRRETFSRAEMEIKRSLRSGHEISFLMLDIDHFKNVNDQYGHLIGDAVLVNLVKCCQDQLRAIDIFGRVGGEEFFVVLPESTGHDAFQLAERLRKHVSTTETATGYAQTIAITISLGIATFNPNLVGETNTAVILKRFFKMSDDAMYQAKSKGRNRTEIWAE
ncbi:GGDEF domain-containing protein [Polynucleobacter sp. 80A-SIGWE]|uniref:GGDEF domain-containing protein n=1 Tax=Polynucleobacter sp. 80A-SIGWE TaxID=2689100 RepID=UPI001C0AD939|nr:GGDEF domain-containing protein [Polynucleobacter sp. 80A-SIGWE]MBU3589332.1 GGDEF domain-containing protein [Polynucleobacter sp. 80A-SIGWE]